MMLTRMASAKARCEPAKRVVLKMIAEDKEIKPIVKLASISEKALALHRAGIRKAYKYNSRAVSRVRMLMTHKLFETIFKSNGTSSVLLQAEQRDGTRTSHLVVLTPDSKIILACVAIGQLFIVAIRHQATPRPAWYQTTPRPAGRVVLPRRRRFARL